MAEKRKTKDFNVPGKRRFSERNPRGKNAEWISFALSNKEMDLIMTAIGYAGDRVKARRVGAGQLLARICKEWMEKDNAG